MSIRPLGLVIYEIQIEMEKKQLKIVSHLPVNIDTRSNNFQQKSTFRYFLPASTSLLSYSLFTVSMTQVIVSYLTGIEIRTEKANKRTDTSWSEARLLRRDAIKQKKCINCVHGYNKNILAQQHVPKARYRGHVLKIFFPKARSLKPDNVYLIAI